MSLPLFETDNERTRAEVLALLASGCGTSDAHTACVNIGRVDGKGYTSYRVTPETRAAVEAIHGWHEVTHDATEPA